MAVVVESHERVRVPADGFEPLSFTARETLSGPSVVGGQYDAVATRTYWYAPAAPAIVKSVHDNPYLGHSGAGLVAMDLR